MQGRITCRGNVRYCLWLRLLSSAKFCCLNVGVMFCKYIYVHLHISMYTSIKYYNLQVRHTLYRLKSFSDFSFHWLF